VQPPARWRRHAEEHADPCGHGRRSQPVTAPDPLIDGIAAFVVFGLMAVTFIVTEP
jgi:hypothetical protein